ncbi:MAG: hypothetical protein P1S46_09945 [bacterium]|nr:hypothetical protein [bacterium]MDT8396607.1 hypothetical protein [bacterium]
MPSALIVLAFLCVACPDPVEGWDRRPASGPPLGTHFPEETDFPFSSSI